MHHHRPPDSGVCILLNLEPPHAAVKDIHCTGHLAKGDGSDWYSAGFAGAGPHPPAFFKPA